VLLRVLVTVDSAALRRRLLRILKSEQVTLVPAGRQPVLEPLRRSDVDLLLASRGRLSEPPADMIRSLRELPERPELLVLVDREDPEERARLLAAGCLAVIYTRLPDDALGETLHTLLERRRADSEQRLRAERSEDHARLGDFVSESPAIQAFMQVARRVVRTDSSLLILGETGVGKERLARAIHAEGPRAAGPFVAVNCGALSESLLESELFGHEEGAFTGASRSRRGYFELAHGGTLFLDEVGEMPQHLQVKLLRVVQDRQVIRVGGERPIPVDVRVMAATNRDLEAEVAGKRFRPDLYYRLAVVTLTVPALRDRREDIPHLASTYVAFFRSTLGSPVEQVAPEALDALVRYGWPGNVRELINVIERAMLLSPGPVLGLADLPSAIAGVPTAAPGRQAAGPLAGLVPRDWLSRPLKELRHELIAEVDRRYLGEMLRATGGRIGEAAARAGLDERSLYDLMRRYGLRKEAYKPPRPRRAG
jgi:DNA-binding NtrC family response regulator